MTKLVFLFIILSSPTLFSQVILIDPGHGGDDCGAKTYINKKKVCEKDISLKISKLLKKELSKYYKVYLTRTIDRLVSLENRAELADKIKADIFISVHVNSSPYKRSQGFETYYLDNHNNVAVKKVEAVENRTATGEQLIVNQILADLVIHKTAPQSRRLGALVHKGIATKLKRKFKSAKDRGVKPALFYVLALSKRPSILLETGFLSNKIDRSRLRMAMYQKDYVEGISIGVRKYFGVKTPPLF